MCCVLCSSLFPLCVLLPQLVTGYHAFRSGCFTQKTANGNIPEADISKEKLEVCVGEIRKWMEAIMLKLKDGKTEYRVIGSNYMIR